MKGINKAIAFITAAIVATACNNSSKAQHEDGAPAIPYYQNTEWALENLKGKVALWYDTTYRNAYLKGHNWQAKEPDYYHVKILFFNEQGHATKHLSLYINGDYTDTLVTQYLYSGDTMTATSVATSSKSSISTLTRIPLSALSYKTFWAYTERDGSIIDTFTRTVILNPDYTSKKVVSFSRESKKMVNITYTYTDGFLSSMKNDDPAHLYNSMFTTLSKDSAGNATAIVRSETDEDANTLHCYGYQYYK